MIIYKIKPGLTFEFIMFVLTWFGLVITTLCFIGQCTFALVK